MEVCVMVDIFQHGPGNTAQGNTTTHLDPFERVDQTAFAHVGGANNININADGDPLHHVRFVRLDRERWSNAGAMPDARFVR